MASQGSNRSIVVRLFDSGPSDPSTPTFQPYHNQTNNTILIDCPNLSCSSLQYLQAAICCEIQNHYQMSAATPFLVAVWQGSKRNSGMRTHITEANVPRVLDMVRGNPKIYFEAHIHPGPTASTFQTACRGSNEQKPEATPQSSSSVQGDNNDSGVAFTEEAWNALLLGLGADTSLMVGIDQFAAGARNFSGAGGASTGQSFNDIPEYSNFNDPNQNFGTLSNAGNDSFGPNGGGGSFANMNMDNGRNGPFSVQPNSGNAAYRSQSYPGGGSFAQGSFPGGW